MREPIKVGDWVAFMCQGVIVHGEVNYIKEHTQHTELYTTGGVVDEKNVLEVRKANNGL